MADGEVMAYRINRDYLSVPWYWGDLRYSGSFVLVRHRVQPGKMAESGLTFYTLYMHLAPRLAYPEQDSAAFKVADGQHLNAYVDASRQWVAADLPPGTRVTWDRTVSTDTMTGNNGRQYAYVTLEEPVTGSMNLKAGDRVWTVCDRGIWFRPVTAPSVRRGGPRSCRRRAKLCSLIRWCARPLTRLRPGTRWGIWGIFRYPVKTGTKNAIRCISNV